jgi:hypothetical protein
MAGKPQKRADALTFTRGGRLERRGPELRPVTSEPRPMPPCPKGLHKKAAAIWRGFWTSNAGAATDMDAYLPALEHWITCVSERYHTQEAIAKNPVGQGSVGQDAPSPLLPYLKELERKIEKYEEAFGMNPLTAMRLNIATVQHAASVHDLTARLEKRREQPDAIEAEAIDLGAL